MRAFGWLLGVVASVGCGKQLNPEFCLSHPDDGDCRDAGLVMIDAAPPCTSNSQCTVAGKGVCDVQLGSCVQCTPPDHSACTGQTTVCSPNDICVGCVTNGDCASSSGICLTETGTCATAGTVLYAAPNGTGTCKLEASPCTLTMALATAKANASYTVIQMAPGDYPEGPLAIDFPIHIVPKTSGTVTITSGATDGPVFAVTKGPTEIDDVTIYGARNADAVTCDKGASLALLKITIRDNPKDGLNTKGNCNVTIDRGTFARNQDSSMYFADTTISVRNSFVFGNGNNNLTAGGISLNGNTSGDLRFNTIAFNTAKAHQGPQPDYVAGIRCAQVKVVNASDNLLADNSPLEATYIGGNCGGNVSTNNWIGSADTVKFANPTGPNYDLHLTAQTPNSGAGTTIRDNANTNCADVPHDYDSDTRPQVTTACDYGGDEYKP